MLYKVFMGEYFAGDQDRVGLVQAESLQEAVAKFLAWFKANAPLEGYQLVGEPAVAYQHQPTGVADGQVEYALVRQESRWEEWNDQGADEYYLFPVGADILMFYIEDWVYLFRYS